MIFIWCTYCLCRSEPSAINHQIDRESLKAISTKRKW